MEPKKYFSIIEHYESCLDRYGDTHRGVDWPNEKDADKRYEVMLDVIKYAGHVGGSLLDFGCGSSHLYEYIRRKDLHNIEYSGLDLSNKFIRLSRGKHPSIKYYCVDVLAGTSGLPCFDFIVMNGVFTEKKDLTFDEMYDYMRKVVKTVFGLAKKGVAFNVMSTHVDWERDDLFHVPFDVMADYLMKDISSRFMFRSDYGLREYTTYVYK